MATRICSNVGVPVSIARPLHRPGRRGRLRPRRGRNRRGAGTDRFGIESAGFKLGTDVALALDAAATGVLHRRHRVSLRGLDPDREQMTEFYAKLLDSYALVSIEDPLSEDDWQVGRT